MANKIKLGNRPKTFKEIEVSITLPDGEIGIIPVTYKYMDRKEFGRWQDDVLASDSGMSGEFSWEKYYEKSAEKSADVLFGVIDSWGLDVPLTKEAIMEVESECGAGAIPALLKAFGDACREGRLGN